MKNPDNSAGIRKNIGIYILVENVVTYSLINTVFSIMNSASLMVSNDRMKNRTLVQMRYQSIVLAFENLYKFYSNQQR